MTEPQGPAAAPVWDVVGIGANSVDLVHLLPAAPQPSGPNAKQRIRRQLVSCGGQMTTTLACVAGFGWRAKYIGATGDDERGAILRAAMQDRRVDMSSALTKEGATNQFAVILVDEIHRRAHRAVDRDERLALQPHEIPEDAIDGARLLHVDDVDQAAAIAAARRGRADGIPVTSDIDCLTDRTPALVAAVTIPMFAEHVPSALTGRADPEAALRALRREHDGLLVVTLGTHGALALDGDRAIQVPGVPRRCDRHHRGRRRLPRRLHPRPALRLAARAARCASPTPRRRSVARGSVRSPACPSLADVEAMLARG